MKMWCSPGTCLSSGTAWSWRPICLSVCLSSCWAHSSDGWRMHKQMLTARRLKSWNCVCDGNRPVCCQVFQQHLRLDWVLIQNSLPLEGNGRSSWTCTLPHLNKLPGDIRREDAYHWTAHACPPTRLGEQRVAYRWTRGASITSTHEHSGYVWLMSVSAESSSFVCLYLGFLPYYLFLPFIFPPFSFSLYVAVCFYLFPFSVFHVNCLLSTCPSFVISVPFLWFWLHSSFPFSISVLPSVFISPLLLFLHISLHASFSLLRLFPVGLENWD
jgi:hypothetical protein